MVTRLMKPARTLPLAAIIGSLFGNPAAAFEINADDYIPTPSQAAQQMQLQQVNVRGRRAVPPSVERKNLEAIQTEMIRDNKDLVRYTPDVGLSDSGRHQKGFAMRGVEGNRVGISIDGVSLPDSEENSLYARYGNFNSSRLAIDPELVRQIDIVKGADSFNTGSGALGGGVNYKTLEARDILNDERKFGGVVKSGYSSRNIEWTNTGGFAWDTGRVDGVALYSQRRGHETESYGRRGHAAVGAGEWPNIRGSARGIPDEARHKYHSFLAKAGFQINENHRVGASANGQQGYNDTVEDSYNLLGSNWRRAHDYTKRRNFNAYYEYTPDSEALALLRIDADYQKTLVGALNHKGNYPTDWSSPDWPKPYQWDNPELDNVYQRDMRTRFKRLSLRADSQPLQWGGEHTLSLRSFIGEREFENLNQDDTYWRGEKYRSTNTIQYPVKTKHYGISLSDHIRWNDTFSSNIGVRYDRTEMKPQDLNAECANCAEKPDANSFSGWSGFAGLSWKFADNWRAGYNVSTGYRVPSASEMYFTFNNGAATWVANPGLKAERSVTHNLSLQGNGSAGVLDLNLYQSNYRNFLAETQYVQSITDPTCSPIYAAWGYCRMTRDQLYWHMENIDKARIRGIEFSGRLNLDRVWSAVPQGWKLFGALGYAKSKLSGDNSLLSTQPLKVMAGLDYESPSDKWAVMSRLTYLGGKKGGDAQYTVYEGSNNSGFTKSVETYPWLNKSAYVFDLFGYYKPVKNLTLRGGVYNLFNRKYHTWDSLRGIYSYSTTNAVDRNNKGLERYYAPGRNYAVSLEYKF